MLKLMLIVFLVVLAVLAQGSDAGSSCKRRVCYLDTCSYKRSGVAKFRWKHIDTSLCTHLVFVQARCPGSYTKFRNIKKKENKKDMKILITVQVTTTTGTGTAIIANTNTRLLYVKKIIRFLRSQNFDGVDLDWEYQCCLGNPTTNGHKVTLLIQEMHDAFVKEAKETGKPRLILSATVDANQNYIDTFSEIHNTVEKLDMLNIMTQFVPMHDASAYKTGHSSPLYPNANETGNELKLNMDHAMSAWSASGAVKENINFGLSLSANTFKLEDPSKNGLGAPTTGPGGKGKYSKQTGILSYYEVCIIKSQGAIVRRISDQRVPYLVKSNIWVGFDDEESVKSKIYYINRQGYGGFAAWSLDMDDFRGKFCNAGTYPLLRAAAELCQG